ncbi:type II toxin-antitoxin system VapC family toxin [Mesorhizobium sp. KR1-2]|uniref:type II toxin-antitoxin system VapC family toxin n=1 Tax=Mesorhizobium sp. KR1-2 TaxID=3156609 RepID=UPI0032B34BDE
MRLIVDTSVVIAILRAEDDARLLVETLGTATQRMMSAGSYLEAGVVMARRDGRQDVLDEFIKRVEIEVAAVTEAEAKEGLRAYQQFGRGSGHAANLNFGDCFSYALAKTRNLPLLFKGDDFIHTDIEPALRPA